MSDDPQPSPLRDRVATATNAVLKLATDASAEDLVERISLEAQMWSRPEATVVVAGESSAGKTSLVNSLLGRPILPTGDDAAEGRFAVVRSGVEGARVHCGDASEPRTIPLSDVAMWLSPVPPGDAFVRGIDVLLDDAVLADGLVLVDTPAIGSMSDAEARITLSTLATADAVLFVVDAGRPISATAIDFLEVASARIETVLVALTKTDRFRGWRDVAADDRRAIVDRLPDLHDIPILPVSNRLKGLADASDGDASLADESGVPRLLEEVRDRVIDRKQRVRLANLLRVDRGTLDDLDRRLIPQVEAGATPSAVQAQVELDERSLEDLRARAEQAQILVTDGFAALRDSAMAATNVALRELSRRLQVTARKQKLPVAALADLEMRAIDADLAAHIDGEASRIADAVSELLSVSLSAVTGAPLDLGDVPETGSGRMSEEVAAKLRMSLAGAVASSGTGLALFASRIASASAPDVLLAVFGASSMIGIVVAGMNLRMTKRQADLQTVKREVQTVVDTVRTSAQPAIRQRVLVSQRALEASLREAVRARTRQLQAAIADGTRLAKADEAERARASATARAQREEVARVRAAIGTLAAEVNQAR